MVLLIATPSLAGLLLGLIVILVPFPYQFFVFGGLIFLFLVLLKPEIAIIIALLIQNQLARFNYLGGDSPFHPNGIMGLALIAGAVFYFFTHKLELSRLKAVGGFLAYLVIGGISLVKAGDYLMDGVTIFLRLLAAFSIYILLIHKIESIKIVKWIFVVIIAAQIIPTVSGLLSQAGLTGLLYTDETVRLGDSGVGVYLSIISLFCTIFFFNSKSNGNRLLWGSLTGLFLAGLFFSFGRSGWIGFVFGLVLMSSIRYKKLLFILPLVILLAVIFVPAIGQRFQDITMSNLGGDGSDTLSGRIRYWIASIEVFKNHPIIGVGLGIGRYRVGDFLGDYSMMIHNDYVSTLVETGVIGFIVFLFWHYRWIVELVKVFQKSSIDFDRTASFAILIILSAVMVMRITDNILLDTYDMYPLCAMIAAVLAIPRIRQIEVKEPHS